jgi:hypothetical protein
MKLRTAIAKSKRRFLLVAFNVSDTHQLEISREQAREVFADYLDLEDEFEDGRFEENNVIAEFDTDGTLYLA